MKSLRENGKAVPEVWSLIADCENVIIFQLEWKEKN